MHAYVRVCVHVSMCECMCTLTNCNQKQKNKLKIPVWKFACLHINDTLRMPFTNSPINPSWNSTPHNPESKRFDMFAPSPNHCKWNRFISTVEKKITKILVTMNNQNMVPSMMGVHKVVSGLLPTRVQQLQITWPSWGHIASQPGKLCTLMSRGHEYYQQTSSYSLDTQI